MKYILVSDIFGRTKSLEKIASALPGDVELVDPYNAKMIDFKNETDAYAYFASEVGLDKYAENLLKAIHSVSEHVTLIGFSVGASAIWKISNQKKLNNISNAACFYGSQIRHYPDIAPLFPVYLIFPASEQHFSVSELIAGLSAKNNLEIQQVSFLHGFMNTHSQNYDPAGYSQFMHLLSNVPLTKAST